MRLIDLTGQRFGKWLVLRRDGKNRRGSSWWLCICDCGNEKLVRGLELRNGQSKSCGCWKTGRWPKGDQHHNWKGGKFKTNGYVNVLTPLHPNARKDGYAGEHIYVMSQHLGRPIDTTHEEVHHKNGKRDDNRIENLELWSTSHPSGQRVEDKVAWAKEILQTYEPRALRGLK